MPIRSVNCFTDTRLTGSIFCCVGDVCCGDPLNIQLFQQFGKKL